MSIVTGRIENREKTEQKIMRFISDKPQYIKDYYRRGLLMGGGSHMTHYTYVTTACRYIMFLKERGINIDDVNSFTYRNTSEFLAHVSQTEVKENNRTAFVRRSNSHFNTTWSSLNKFFKFLIAEGLLKENPLDKIPRSKGKDHPSRVYMEAQDVQEVIRKVNEDKQLSEDHSWKAYRDAAIFEVLIQTGIRVTALCEINIDNVEFVYNDDGVVAGATIQIIDKEETEFARFVSVHTAKTILEWMVIRERMLADAKVDTNALFIGTRLDRICSRTVERIVAKYSPTINGKKITPHKYRATYGTTLYKATHDIHYVQKQMGHASPVTTTIYVVDDGADERKAASIMDGILVS